MIKKVSSPIILLVLIPIILTIIWFRHGNIMGTAEAGLPFYDFQIQYNVNKNAWAHYALGYPTNISIAAKPTYWFMAQLQKMGIPGFILQASFFWIVFVVSGVSTYLITKNLFPSLSRKFLTIAVLFYWFNPFSMVNIWNRFLNNFFVFYMLLPLSLLLFLKGLQTRRYIYAFIIGLISTLFSYALSSVAFNILLWLVLFYMALFYIFIYKDIKYRLFIAKFFTLTLLFWCFANFWWISQTFSYVNIGSFSAVTSTSFIVQDNYRTLLSISERLGNLINLFRLRHASFFDDQQIPWTNVYNFPLLVFLEFWIIGLVLLPLIFFRKSNYQSLLFFGGLFFIGLYLSKGSNQPFGEVFDEIFLTFSFLQVFRNPFEKFGFILPIAAAPLFGYGVFLLLTYLKTFWQKLGYLIILIWLIGVWGFPFWSGFIFMNGEKTTNNENIDYKVKVPPYYKDLDNWLKAQNKDFRLVVFPIWEEGITYLWDKNYSGVELSNQLLSKTSVSFNTNIPFYDKVSNSLERSFLTKDDFSKIMKVLDARYILLRPDIDWNVRRMRDPKTINERLESLERGGKLRKIKQFGQLSLWEYPNWQENKIYVADRLVSVSGRGSLDDMFNISDFGQQVLNNLGNIINDPSLVKAKIIHPSYGFTLGSREVSEGFRISGEIIFPAVRFSPKDRFYSLILLKEQTELSLLKGENSKIVKQISLLGKRLVEAQRESESGNVEGVGLALAGYSKQFDKLTQDISVINLSDPKDLFQAQEELYKIFEKHLAVLEKLKNQSQNDVSLLSDVSKKIKDRLIQIGIIPYFGFLEKSNYPIERRIVYQFYVETEGEYELLLDSKNWEKYYKISSKEPFRIQFDNELFLREGEIRDNELVSYGTFYLTSGKHEIAWNTPPEKNLIEVPSEMTLEVSDGVFKKTFPVKDFDPYSTYLLSLDYLIKKGSGVEVRFEQNNDRIKDGELEPSFAKMLGPDSDGYYFGTNNYSAYFSPSVTADSAELVFRVTPWNNCTNVYWHRGKERCKNKDFRGPYNRTTEVVVKDISLIKVITEEPILIRQEKDNKNESTVPEIQFSKVSNVEYTFEVENAKNPYILVLNELFDPGWKVLDKNLKDVGEKHFLANTYANGWVINKEGNYQLLVKYVPQDLLKASEKISFGSTFLGLLFIGWSIWRKYGKKV